MYQIKKLNLSSLVIDRLPLTRRTLALANHLANGGTVPPIHIQKQGNLYKILDGRHRFLAHKLVGKDEILVKYKEILNTCKLGHNLNQTRKEYTRQNGKKYAICMECNRLKANEVRRLERESLEKIKGEANKYVI